MKNSKMMYDDKCNVIINDFVDYILNNYSELYDSKWYNLSISYLKYLKEHCGNVDMLSRYSKNFKEQSPCILNLIRQNKNKMESMKLTNTSLPRFFKIYKIFKGWNNETNIEDGLASFIYIPKPFLNENNEVCGNIAYYDNNVFGDMSFFTIKNSDYIISEMSEHDFYTYFLPQVDASFFFLHNNIIKYSKEVFKNKLIDEFKSDKENNKLSVFVV